MAAYALQSKMMTNEYSLELSNVFHNGPVEPGSYFQKLLGNVPTGVILKEVSLQVHSGEMMAILGSKGSGKRALLEVISRRAQGPTRGQILLRKMPMSLRLFQESCGYVSPNTQLHEGLTARQTLTYAANLSLSSNISGSMLSSRVSQVLADMALTQATNHFVHELTPSEYRRLVIAIQIIKDPLVLLLDEPAWGLDPLNTYLLVSILSNHAKKYSRIVVITMEKPRSDIFPFLDRVTYLCLGDIVYTGSTRLMLDYFRGIGFPCPELENPLMYYLCLSTVDRRSRDRFIESNNQIAALVERFKVEGGPFRKFTGPSELDPSDHKIPLFTYGQPGIISSMWTLFKRSYSLLLPTNRAGFHEIFLRLILLPLYFFLLWNFYFPLQSQQRSFQSVGGLIFNCLAGTALLSAASTASTFSSHRTRYYHEARNGLYRGPLFLVTYFLFSAPLAYLTVMSASSIAYFGLGLDSLGTDTSSATQGTDWFGWFVFGTVLFTVWGYIEQQTVALMLVIKSSYTAAVVSTTITILYLIVGAASLRSLVDIPDWLYLLSHTNIFKFSSAVLHEQTFYEKLVALPANGTLECRDNNAEFGCRYRNGTYYLLERYHFPFGGEERQDLDLWPNFGFSFVFYIGMFITNVILFLIPLPAFIKSKFRE